MDKILASRFYTRWLQADERRAAQSATWAAAALGPSSFADMLRQETDACAFGDADGAFAGRIMPDQQIEQGCFSAA